MTLTRRDFVRLAAALGASLAWGGPARASTAGWHEGRDLYPEGVASGDPDPSSVILWTRRPFESGGRRVLTVEVAEDHAFRRVVAKASAPVSAESDWTTRVLVGHLKPARVFWYRFTDGEGNGSRVGRTITAPLANADPDLQDARARWPFVAIWDNHEFSWQGRQSIVQAGGAPQPGQTVKVAANQAWFEYIPARVKAPSGSLDTFGALAVKNVPIEK